MPDSTHTNNRNTTKASFIAYIDESGDEGFSFRTERSSGSSQWFVLSAVITRKESDLKTVKIVDKIRSRLNKNPKYDLHFRNLKHHERIVVLQEITSPDTQLRIISICIHKPSLNNRASYQERYRLYFYATRYLLERISWLCREAYRRESGAGNGFAELIFSNRANMSYSDLSQYLKHLKVQSATSTDIQIDWNHISPELITAINHSQSMGLKLADAVASSTFYALDPNLYGNVELSYINLLKPKFFRKTDTQRIKSYGIKLFPSGVSGLEEIN